MAEHTEFDANEQLFHALDAVQMEPELTRMFGQMRAYNELLREQPVDEVQINEIIQEFDQAWRPFMKQEALISGYIQPSEELEDDGPQRHFVSGQVVRFRGAFPDEQEHLTVSTDHEVPRYYILHLMVEYDGLDRDGRFGTTQALVALDDLISLEFSSYMSPQRARHVLENFQPELLAGIYEAFLAITSDGDECESVLRLDELFYDPGDDDEVTKSQTVMALSSYCNESVTFDEFVGYSMTIDGDCWTVDDDGAYHKKTVRGDYVTRVGGLSWLTSTAPGDERVIPHVSLVVCGRRANTLTDVYHVPLGAIKEFNSFRYGFYSEQ